MTNTSDIVARVATELAQEWICNAANARINAAVRIRVVRPQTAINTPVTEAGQAGTSGVMKN